MIGMVRVAINGFGRIGRQVLQAGINEPSIEWVAVNDITDTPTLAYLLKYDSVYGRFKGDVGVDGNDLVVNGKKIRVLREKEPSNLPWRDLKIDIVVESSGLFTSREGAASHLKAGAKKVIISAPANNPDITVVKGVNENLYDKNKHHIVSNASCTTNCLAPIVKVLHDNFGIEYGFMTTVHAYTADQRLVDAPHKDLRRGRSAAQNLVPTTTGAAKTVAEVIPELKGKLDGLAIRAPVICGSVTDFVCRIKKETTRDKINWLFEEVSKFHLKGVLEFTRDEIVSSDIIHNPHSCIFDSAQTMVISGNFVKVIGWYDNEWGYSMRVVDLIKMIL